MNWYKSIYIFKNNAFENQVFIALFVEKFEYKSAHNNEEIKILMINF